jgi:hypothetical protein
MGLERLALLPSRSRYDRGSAGGLMTPALRRALGLIWVLGLCCAPAALASQRLAGDFDGDGLRDHIAVSRQDPTILRVWLSSTRRIDIIRSREPILHIAAADLDGDARPELVARLASSLRVWNRRNGRFHTYRPRARSAAPRLSRARNHASNADPLCADLSATEYSLVAPSMESSTLVMPPLPAIWIDAGNPVRGPTSGAPVHPFTPRPPPVSTL